MKTQIVDLIKSLGFRDVAKEFLEGKHSAKRSLEFVALCLRFDKERYAIAKAALDAVIKEGV